MREKSPRRFEESVKNFPTPPLITRRTTLLFIGDSRKILRGVYIELCWGRVRKAGTRTERRRKRAPGLTRLFHSKFTFVQTTLSAVSVSLHVGFTSHPVTTRVEVRVPFILYSDTTVSLLLFLCLGTDTNQDKTLAAGREDQLRYDFFAI